jgi:hypothetical protein
MGEIVLGKISSVRGTGVYLGLDNLFGRVETPSEWTLTKWTTLLSAGYANRYVVFDISEGVEELFEAGESLKDV